MFEHLTPGRNLCKSMQEEHGNARNMEVHTTLFADKVLRGSASERRVGLRRCFENGCFCVASFIGLFLFGTTAAKNRRVCKRSNNEACTNYRFSPAGL